MEKDQLEIILEDIQRKLNLVIKSQKVLLKDIQDMRKDLHSK